MPKQELPDFGTTAGRTAIARKAVSVPTRTLIASGRIPEGASVLNHGRGRADADAAALENAAGEYAEFDPNHAPNPDALTRRYDVVISNYVMNVLPPDIRPLAWQDVARCTGGVAYVTVRSTGDKAIYKGKKHKDGFIMSIGTFQKPYTSTALMREAKKYFNSVEIIMGTKGGISWTAACSDPKIAGPGEPETPEQRKKPSTATKRKVQRKAAQRPVDVPGHMDLDPDQVDQAEIDRIRELAGIAQKTG